MNHEVIKTYARERYNSSHHIIYPPDDFAVLVYDNIKYYQDERDRWRDEAQYLKENARREVTNEYAEENRDLKEQLSMSFGSFTFPEEKEHFDTFVENHVLSCRMKNKISNGEYPYVKMHATGLGIIYEAVCPVCGRIEDVTYSEGW